MAVKPKPNIRTVKPVKSIEKKTFGNNRTVRIISVSIILLFTFLLYLNSIHNDFITNYDDKPYIIDSPYLNNLSFASLKSIFSNYYVANYHPLTTLTWAIENKFAGLNPATFHFDNLILHLINVLLVFQLLIVLTKRNEAAIVGTLLFAFHPMHVESVAWISERKDVLYACFYLISVLFYIKYISKSKNKLSIIHYPLSIVFFVLSAFSKSAAITLPFVLILLDFYYSRFNLNQQLVKQKNKFSIFNFQFSIILEKLPFFIISFIFGYVAMVSQNSVGAVNLLFDFNFIDKVFFLFYSVSYYIVSFIIPCKFALIHYYPVKVNGLLPLKYYLSPLLIVGLIILILKSGKFKLDLIFGFLFFASGLILIVQFIPLGPAIVSERYSYIPYFGFSFIIGQLYVRIIDNKALIKHQRSLRLLMFSIIGLLCVFFVVSTYNLNQVWKNNLTLFGNLVEKYPESDMANYNFAYANYLADNYDVALKYFDKTISLNPLYTKAYLSRGLVRHNIKDYKGEIEDCTQTLRLDPQSGDAYNNRGSAHAMLKDYKDAIYDYNKALDFKKDFATYLNRANAKLMLNDYKNALDDYNICLKYDAHDPKVYYFRGVAEYNINEKKVACDDWHIASLAGYSNADEKIKQFCK